MSNELYLITALIIGCFGLIAWFISWKLKQLTEAGKANESLLRIITDLQRLSPELQKSLQNQSKNIADTLHRSTKTLNERLDNAAKYMSEVSQADELFQICPVPSKKGVVYCGKRRIIGKDEYKNKGWY